jgi:hypothetical protein
VLEIHSFTSACAIAKKLRPKNAQAKPVGNFATINDFTSHWYFVKCPFPIIKNARENRWML